MSKSLALEVRSNVEALRTARKTREEELVLLVASQWITELTTAVLDRSGSDAGLHNPFVSATRYGGAGCIDLEVLTDAASIAEGYFIDEGLEAKLTTMPDQTVEGHDAAGRVISKCHGVTFYNITVSWAT